MPCHELVFYWLGCKIFYYNVRGTSLSFLINLTFPKIFELRTRVDNIHFFPTNLTHWLVWNLLEAVRKTKGTLWLSTEFQLTVFSHSLFLQFSRSVVSDSVISDSLRPHESQHARPPCPSPTPGVYSNSCPSSQWYKLFKQTPKKGNAKECSNYPTFTLISQASEIMLKILQTRLQQYVKRELQAGLRKGRGSRDQIANIRWIIKKNKRIPEKHLFLFYWLCQSLWLCGTQ